MANWLPLRQMLAGVEGSLTVLWDELDRLVGGLPASAYNHPAFWAGDRSAWAGFRTTDVRVGHEVTFARTGTSPARESFRSVGDPTASTASEEWHTEANVQAALVRGLIERGWSILSVANTASREKGVDVVAQGGDVPIGFEVKGFPSRTYADPTRREEAKRTPPSLQAGHYFAGAVLAAMRLRGREPEWRSAIALPNFPRYRKLASETAGSLRSARIEVWWIHEDGSLTTT